jgi:hypothetical protein
MVSAYTPNIQLEEPARGDQVGTWDVPVNNNMTVIDSVVGAVTSISLNNSPVVLTGAQFQSRMIAFNSTLTGSVAITFPTSFTKSYEIFNRCTGSSAFIITLRTTVAGSYVVCAPPGEIVEIVNIGGSMFYKNLGRVGSYLDYGGPSVPNWVAGCSIAPYLNCDGTAFNAAAYPALAMILGGTTLPDTRGRTRFNLNQGTTRLTNAISLNGDVRFAGGGDENYQAHTHANALVDLGHRHNWGPAGFAANVAGTGAGGDTPQYGTTLTQTSQNITGPMSITNVQAGTGNWGNVPPGYIGGITMIRSA